MFKETCLPDLTLAGSNNSFLIDLPCAQLPSLVLMENVVKVGTTRSSFLGTGPFAVVRFSVLMIDDMVLVLHAH